MSLLRFAGRVLFAVPYAMDGYKMITRPEHDEEQIAAAVDRVLPLASRLLPEGAMDRLPAESRTWTRIFGGLQLAGAAAYATGIGRRGGAWALVLASLPKLGSQGGMVADLGMLGAAVVATQDTAGKPSLAWRAAQAPKQLESQATDFSKAVKRSSQNMGLRFDVARASAAKSAAVVGNKIGKCSRKAVKKVSKGLEN